MSVTAIGAKANYADSAQTWSYFQNVYTKQAEDTTDLLITRRSFFRNGVLTIIPQVDHQPTTRTPMLASLMDYVDLSGSTYLIERGVAKRSWQQCHRRLEPVAVLLGRDAG